MEGVLKSKERPEDPGARDTLIALYRHVSEQLDMETNYPRIWDKIKKKLEVLGDKPIVFEKYPTMKVYAKTEYGVTHGKNENVIRYNPDREYVAHLFVHEMMHLELMIADTKFGKGKVFISTADNKLAFRKRYFQFYKKRYRNVDMSKLNETFNRIFDGFSLQILNCPLDLFVEDKIYNEYEDMRSVQFLSLMRMEQENIRQANNKDIVKYAPAELVRANKVMNMCSSLHFKQLYGIDLVNQYNPTSDEYNQAKDLYDEYCA